MYQAVLYILCSAIAKSHTDFVLTCVQAACANQPHELFVVQIATSRQLLTHCTTSCLQHALTNRIIEARKKLKSVQIPYDFRVKISAICSELNVDGIRGDIVTNRAAKALAAFEGRDEVAVEDIYRWV